MTYSEITDPTTRFEIISETTDAFNEDQAAMFRNHRNLRVVVGVADARRAIRPTTLARLGLDVLDGMPIADEIGRFGDLDAFTATLADGSSVEILVGRGSVIVGR